MKKKLQTLLPLFYFIPAIYFLNFLYTLQSRYSTHGTTQELFAIYLVGIIYSIFIVMFLFSIDPSKKKQWSGIVLAITLALTWSALVFSFTLFLSPLIYFILNGSVINVPISMFFTTFIGTYSFMKLFSKWDKFPRLNVRFLYLKFSTFTMLLSLFFLEHEPDFIPKGTMMLYTNIFLISLIWQIVMTFFLWRKMTGDKEIEADKITLESRDAGQLGQISKEELLSKLQE